MSDSVELQFKLHEVQVVKEHGYIKDIRGSPWAVPVAVDSNSGQKPLPQLLLVCSQFV